jgi:hypothetical protein
MTDSPTPAAGGSLDLPLLRSQLAALYLQVAATLDESAQLAEGHAERCRTRGRSAHAAAEMETARKARAAARRGRAAAADLSAAGLSDSDQRHQGEPAPGAALSAGARSTGSRR